MAQQVSSKPNYIQIQRRPWYVYVVGVLWILLMGFLVQNAIGSAAELEPRAALIFWVSAGVVLLAGVVIAFLRSRKERSDGLPTVTSRDARECGSAALPSIV